MAETTTISLDGQESPPSSDQGSLDTSDTTRSTQAGAPAGVSTETLQRDLDTLKAQNERYLRERNGWESQSRSNLEANRQLTERMARLEGVLSTRPDHTSSNDPPKLPSMKTALKKWLDGDDSEIEQVEQALSTLTSGRSTSQLDSKVIDERVDQRLASFGARSQRQVWVGRQHPELADNKNPLYGVIYNNYDVYANNPDTRFMFPKDEAFEVPWDAPDGSGRQMVDTRIVDRMTLEAKLRLGTRQQAREEDEETSQTRGTSETGAGRTTRTPSSRSVEALDLMTQKEIDLIDNPDIRKGWPTLPKDRKAAAKYLYDGLDPLEKSRRMAEYKRSVRTGA